MMDELIINCNIEALYGIRNEHFDEDKQYIKKFWLRLNETNVIQLINDIEKKISLLKDRLGNECDVEVNEVFKYGNETRKV